MKPNEFYCVSCKDKVICNAKDIRVAKLKNGKPALKSKCKCGCNLTKFIKASSVTKYKSKFKSKRKSVKKSKKRSRKRSS
jgi:hypothetical protein